MSRYVIISLILGIFLTQYGDFAPVKYDQRQDGKYNVHAKLENFLIVVATSGSNDGGSGGGGGGLLGDLAAQALEFKNLASSAVAAKAEEAEREDESAKDDKGEETSIVQAGDKEPYRVEIVRVQKDESHQLEKQKGRVNIPTSKEEIVKTLKDVNVSVSGGTGERKMEDILQSLKHLSDAGKIEKPHHGNTEISEHAIANQGPEKSESIKEQAPVVRISEHKIPSSHDTLHPESVGKVGQKIQESQEEVIHTRILDGNAEESAHKSGITKIVTKTEPAIAASIAEKIPEEKIDGTQVQGQFKEAQSLSNSQPAVLPVEIVKRSLTNHKKLVGGGTSVKKELSGVKPATLAENSEDDLEENRPEEYKLLTDGVHGLENCGPSAYRDNKDLMCKIKKPTDDRN